MKNDLKIVFFGTPEFAVPALQSLLANDFNIAAVVTQPDKPVGRTKVLTAPPVKVLAQENNIPVLQPDKFSNLTIKQLNNFTPDLFVIVAYGKILPQELIDIPHFGAVNIHPSLLPKYRGPSPLQAQILNGENKTGVSIMLIDNEMDHGPILKNYELRITNYAKYNQETLGKELFEIGAKHLPKTIEKYISGEVKPQEQDHSQATFTKLIKKEDGEIDWTKPAEYIEHMTRAYWPWPSAYGQLTTYNLQLTTKILKAHVGQEQTNFKPGTLFTHSTGSGQETLAVACGENSILIIDKLQISGKHPISGPEFIRGHLPVRPITTKPPLFI